MLNDGAFGGLTGSVTRCQQMECLVDAWLDEVMSLSAVRFVCLLFQISR
jgi:hypothetical protein